MPVIDLSARRATRASEDGILDFPGAGIVIQSSPGAVLFIISSQNMRDGHLVVEESEFWLTPDQAKSIGLGLVSCSEDAERKGGGGDARSSVGVRRPRPIDSVGPAPRDAAQRADVSSCNRA